MVLTDKEKSLLKRLLKEDIENKESFISRHTSEYKVIVAVQLREEKELLEKLEELE